MVSGWIHPPPESLAHPWASGVPVNHGNHLLTRQEPAGSYSLPLPWPDRCNGVGVVLELDSVQPAQLHRAALGRQVLPLSLSAWPPSCRLGGETVGLLLFSVALLLCSSEYQESFHRVLMLGRRRRDERSGRPGATAGSCSRTLWSCRSLTDRAPPVAVPRVLRPTSAREGTGLVAAGAVWAEFPSSRFGILGQEQEARHLKVSQLLKLQ